MAREMIITREGHFFPALCYHKQISSSGDLELQHPPTSALEFSPTFRPDAQVQPPTCGSVVVRRYAHAVPKVTLSSQGQAPAASSTPFERACTVVE